jgi:hypothetical protein
MAGQRGSVPLRTFFSLAKFEKRKPFWTGHRAEHEIEGLREGAGLLPRTLCPPLHLVGLGVVWAGPEGKTNWSAGVGAVGPSR